uniref:E3 ubiquitin-protein ligase Topors isoform X1 n=2 Tax=Myxine glutinosa TaxID=7769 RepID=UPI00358F8215
MSRKMRPMRSRRRRLKRGQGRRRKAENEEEECKSLLPACRLDDRGRHIHFCRLHPDPVQNPDILKSYGQIRPKPAGHVGCVTRKNRIGSILVMDMSGSEGTMGSRSDKTSCGSFRLPSDASPDSKCPICLDRIQNRALTNSCFHSFCFLCILEWAKSKAECPLCKQTFDRIIHSVESDTNYKEYILTPGNDSSLSSPEGRRFRYRSTMTRERWRQWRWQYESGSYDGGVLFEGASRQRSLRSDVEIEQMTQQLRERRHAPLKNRNLQRLQEQEMITFRRALYRKGLRVKRVEDGGRYRDVSAEFFRQNPACLHRLVPWIKRELTVLFGEHMCVINIVKHLIMSTISLYDLDSETFRQDLKPFIVHRTDHFLHELLSFARSPFNVDAYDERACYTESNSHDGGYVDSVISSSTDDSVIPLSPDFESVLKRDQLPDELSPSLSGWDDVTPGPSYVSPSYPHDLSTSRVSSTSSGLPPSPKDKDELSLLENQQSAPLCKVETDSKADEDDMEECLIVGYVKPRCERTPELVTLSSDSESEQPGPSFATCNTKVEILTLSATSRTVSVSTDCAPDNNADSEGTDLTSPHSSDSNFLYADGEAKDTHEVSEQVVVSEMGVSSKLGFACREVLNDANLSHMSCNTELGTKSTWCDSSSYKTNSRLSSRSSSDERSNVKKDGRVHGNDLLQQVCYQQETVSNTKFAAGCDSGKNISYDDKARGREDKFRHSEESLRRRHWGRDSYRNHDHDRYYDRNWKVDSERYNSWDKERAVNHSWRSHSWESKDQNSRTRSYDKSHGRRSSESNYHRRGRSRSWERSKRSYSSDGRSRERERGRHCSAKSTETSSDKPRGKRKCKTRHMEQTTRHEKDAERTKSLHSKSYQSPGQYRDRYRNRSRSPSRDSKRHQRHHHSDGKRGKSSSVEIVFEGKLTIETECYRKSAKKKKHKRSH